MQIKSAGYRGDGVAIGCLDTGVDGDHPSLLHRVASFRFFGPDGFSVEDRPPTDTSWHGTHIAGLIAGGSHDGGSIGVAPGALLYCGAVIEDGYILARILSGLDWLAGCGLSVANLSLGIKGASPVFRTMVRVLAAQDVLITAPIGNHGAGNATVPGIYPEVLSVGATDENGRVAKFSGSLNHAVTKACEKPDLIAPGVALMSAIPGDRYEARSGTSMASAVVAGIAALLRGAFPNASAAVVTNALLATSSPIQPDQGHRARLGAISFASAFEHLQREENADIVSAAPFMPFPKFLDQRLTSKLSYSVDTNDQDAILEFADHEACMSFAHGIDRTLTRNTSNGYKVIKLTHAPICIVRCSALQVKQALDSSALLMASACDVDRAVYFK